MVFSLRNDDEEYGIWKRIVIQNKGVGKRYGHTLNYLNPIFILFGSSSNNQLLNEVWIVDIKMQNPNYYVYIKNLVFVRKEKQKV